MTLADLARAAGMEPSNLRRMLTSPAANPRLDTVMRLLGPLGAALGPAGARAASEVAESLDAARRRRGATWRSLLADHGRNSAAIVRRLKADPGSLPIDVVMRLAEALDVDIMVVDAREDAATASAMPPGDAVHDAPARPRSRRRAAGANNVGDDAGSRRSTRAPAPVAAPASVEPPAPAPAWPPPLRPPRLGRYRDAPPPSPRPQAPVPSADVATTGRSAPAFALERALLSKLADLSAATWRRIYRWLGARLLGTRDAPAELLDDLADRTAETLGRLRRPGDSGDLADAAEGGAPIDPETLLETWRRSKEPGLPSGDTLDAFDAAGRHLVAHYCLDRQFGMVVAPSEGREPSRLVKILRTAPRPGWWDLDIPLAVRIEGDLHPFTHVRAGAVLGELLVGDFGYLLAGISAHLAILEITRSGHRVAWCGRAEDLPRVDIRRPQDLEDVASSPPGPDPGAAEPEPDRRADEVAAAHRQRDDLHQQLAALTADHAAMKEQLRIEQTASAESREEVEDLRRRNASLRVELEALRAAAEEQAASLEQEIARLADELAEARGAAGQAHAAVADAQAKAEAEANARAALADELTTTRLQLAKESDARLAAENKASRAEQVLEEKMAALAELAAAQGSLLAEVAELRQEARGAIAEADEQLVDERLAHAATREQAEELRRRLAAIEGELAAAREALSAANEASAAYEEQAWPPEPSIDDETPQVEDLRERDEADAHASSDASADLADPTEAAIEPPASMNVEALLAPLAEVDPERLADLRHLAESPDLPQIALLARLLAEAMARKMAAEEVSALRLQLETTERRLQRAIRAPKPAQKGRKKPKR